MNKKLTTVIIAVILLFIAGFTYMLLSRVDTGSTSLNKEERQLQQNSAANTAMTGNYIDYSSDFISSTKGTKILFFYAPWCPQCRELESDIQAMGVPEGVTIAKIDYDSNQKLKQKYGVTLQTTLVKVDDEGNLIEKYVAYDDPSIQAVIENLL